MGVRLTGDLRRCLVAARGVVGRGLSLLVAVCLTTAPAPALVHIDFEQAYYVHPDLQVWDFCLIEYGGTYSIFYHAIPEAQPYPSAADHIWWATSPDLIHWSDPVIVLSVSSAPYESAAVWAPDVIFRESTHSWWMAYTGVDAQSNQTICMAWSADLRHWGKFLGNPAVVPDPDVFLYIPANGWAVCRDPYLYAADGLWHMLISVKVPGMPGGQGALAHTTAPDLLSWSPTEVFAVNDGATPTRILESSTYLVRDGIHHLFYFLEGVHGVMHVAATAPGDWSFDDAFRIGMGVAPEVDTFDGGAHYLISRIGQYVDHPESTTIHCVARFDTLLFAGGLAHPAIQNRSPLTREFAVHEGTACVANPTFGDNPARRGDPPGGLAGCSYFGSAEYFQGPLGAGSAAYALGDTLEGLLETAPFTIDGDTLSLLVGGTNHPEHCYVALVDAQTDEILRLAHGTDNATMTRQHWDLQGLRGRLVYLRIEDSDRAGHLNVDDIVESPYDPTTDAPAVTTPAALRDLGPAPNPANPGVSLRFTLARASECRVTVHDLRGRLVWDSRPLAGVVGLNTVAWPGCHQDGRRAAGGVYLYRVAARGLAPASGKLVLVP